MLCICQTPELLMNKNLQVLEFFSIGIPKIKYLNDEILV